jgi:hypothetical protein
MRRAGGREKLADLKWRVQAGAGVAANGRRTGGAVETWHARDSQRQ